MTSNNLAIYKLTNW